MNHQIAAELNNLGGAYLQAGDLKKSMEFFRDALKYTLSDLHVQESSVVIDPSAQGPWSGSSPQLYQAHDSFTQAACDFMDREAIVAVPSSVPFVHTQAINVIPTPKAYSHDHLVNTTVTSSIVLFNLGIVYHLKGLEGTGESTVRLSKARSLYQKSQLLLADAGVPSSSTGNPIIDMLYMALSNNLAQASFEMQCYHDSRRYFDQLIRFALSVSPARYGDTTIATMVDQQKSNFLLNAIILHAPKLAAAA